MPRVLLFLTLFASIIPFCQTVSAADSAQWMAVNIPQEGSIGKWTLANGSDIRHLTIANDGTLYCYANHQVPAIHFLDLRTTAAVDYNREGK